MAASGSSCSHAMNRPDESVVWFERAIEHYETLGHSNPDTYLPQAARLLAHLETIHAAAGRDEAARTTRRRATELNSSE